MCLAGLNLIEEAVQHDCDQIDSHIVTHLE